MNNEDNVKDDDGQKPSSGSLENEIGASHETQPFRDPMHWKTGDEPITAAQKSYLSTLATEAGQPENELDELTKAEASIRIDGTSRENRPRPVG